MKIVLHADLSIHKSVEEDKSGYARNDTVPQLEKQLDEFTRREVQRLSVETHKKVTVDRAWIELS